MSENRKALPAHDDIDGWRQLNDRLGAEAGRNRTSELEKQVRRLVLISMLAIKEAGGELRVEDKTLVRSESNDPMPGYRIEAGRDSACRHTVFRLVKNQPEVEE